MPQMIEARPLSAGFGTSLVFRFVGRDVRPTDDILTASLDFARPTVTNFPGRFVGAPALDRCAGDEIAQRSPVVAVVAHHAV